MKRIGYKDYDENKVCDWCYEDENCYYAAHPDTSSVCFCKCHRR